MKIKSYILLFLVCAITAIGCTRNKEVPYEKKQKFEDYLRAKDVQLKGDVLVVALQPECECTAEHIKFTQELISSPKYSQYKKVVIVPDTTHSIIGKIKAAGLSSVRIVIDENQGLRRAGVVMSVDRVFLFNDDRIVKLSDMHLTKYKDLIQEYL
ncbi:hypothetical protein [Mucilaginibacter psychrotolerans]|uniref:Uncharacterized protein n=1 Tax=Mucilaginibacter psychrotolerans TaxID=1524096 RepID=A0A4Y8SAL5_9SPHI|nr:hypothetical protein [Mucilaginibacter psychrotolerans]TFF35426.1 hypothetical protein E2R66_19415 [Mucilaginibacter psychrotolerans]